MAIFGAAPTGLATAYLLAELDRPQREIYERDGHIGGPAGECQR